MNWKPASTLAIQILKTTGILAVLFGIVDTLGVLLSLGLEARGLGMLLPGLVLGWALVFAPAALFSWILCLGCSITPGLRGMFEKRSSAAVAGITVFFIFLGVSFVLAFRAFLPTHITMRTPTGMGTSALLFLLSLAAGLVAGWCAARAKPSRRNRYAAAGGVGIVLITALLLSLAGGERPQAGAGGNPEGSAHPNVFVILIDTLRADALGCYGAGEDASPEIDQFARDSVLYKNAFTSASWTRPAMASLWTGLNPSTHQVRRGNKMMGGADRLSDKALTLAEYLGAEGYATHGLNTNPVILPQFGLAQGFDTYYTFPRPALGSTLLIKAIGGAFSSYYTPNHYENGESLTRAAIEWLDQQPANPFLLYIHYMDPHDPYWESPGKTWSGMFPRTRREHAEVSRQRYRGEVRYVDRQVGRLFKQLRDKGLYDGSLIVIVSDHGEAFFEHGVSGHGDNLTQEEVHVPLIIKFPGGVHAGLTVEESVSICDVAPTVLQTAGLNVPGSMQGRALAPRKDGDGLVFCETGIEEVGIRSVSTPEWRLILRNGPKSPDITVPDVALFDRKSDPYDMRDVSSAHPDIVESLKLLIDDHLDECFAEALPREAASMNREVRDRMNALGYLR